MFRRPARDRNYEFWGDQTFFGENPPQAAVISWFNKKDVGDVELRITDAAGREVREISRTGAAPTARRPGIQSACWDLRVQPVPDADLGQRPAAPGWRRRAAAAGRRRAAARRASRSAPAAPAAAAAVAAASAAAAAATPVRTCCPGTYNVSLVVDGKTVDTKPLRVDGRPRGRADRGRAQAPVRHGDGDARPAAPRQRRDRVDRRRSAADAGGA